MPGVRERIVNRAINPLLMSLPEKFEGFRGQQIEAIVGVLRAFKRGEKVVVLDAPTGSGKTLIGETVRRMMTARALYTCSSLSLQDQFVADFPRAAVIKGRRNYPTERFPDLWPDQVSCDDCTWTRKKPRCEYCSEKRGKCPYEVAKYAAMTNDLAVLNSSYLLSELNGPGAFKGRALVIADECDTLEQTVMGHVSVEIGRRRMQKYGWSAPKVTVEKDWLRWVQEAREDVWERLTGMEDDESDAADKERKYLNPLWDRLTKIVQDMGVEGSPWVYTGDKDEVAFKPARVTGFGEELIWKWGERWLLMSATVISAGDLLWSLGWKGSYESLSLPSTFPVKNRPVVVWPLSNMGRKTQDAEIDKLLAGVCQIGRERASDRILIHTVSYALTAKVVEAIRQDQPARRVFTYTSSGGRAAAIELYRRYPGSILVAPSLDRGVDLPGDLCRVQIVVKVPYPNLGDKVINARFHTGQEGRTWYTIQTIRSLVQMTGRGVRSEEDFATTYILDSQFNDLWMRSSRLFPSWWRDALEWRR